MRGWIVAAALVCATAARAQTPPRVGIISEGIAVAPCGTLGKCWQQGFALRSSTALLLTGKDGQRREVTAHYLEKDRVLVRCTQTFFPDGPPKNMDIGDFDQCYPVRM